MALKRSLKTLDGVAEAVAALYTKQDDGSFLLEVEGVEDTTGLKTTVKALRDENDDFKKQLKAFEGIDLDQVRNLLKNSKDTEEQRLVKEGKIDEVIARRTQQLVEEHNKALKKMTDELGGEKTKGQKMHQRVLDAALAQAAAQVGVHKPALEDIMLRGRTMFSLDNDSNVVMLKDGSVVLGKDAKSPLQPVEWLESMRETATHWFPAGGGGSGTPNNNTNRQGGKDAKQLTRTEFDALSPAEKVAKSKEGVQLID